MTATFTPSQLLTELAGFSGGDLFYRHPLNRSVIYTEGVRFLAETAEAHWLIDAVTSYFGSPEMQAATSADGRLESLQFWRLEVREDHTAELTARADDGVEPFITQTIEWTDFPLPKVDIWAGFNGEGWTLYLPSEH